MMDISVRKEQQQQNTNTPMVGLSELIRFCRCLELALLRTSKCGSSLTRSELIMATSGKRNTYDFECVPDRDDWEFELDILSDAVIVGVGAQCVSSVCSQSAMFSHADVLLRESETSTSAAHAPPQSPTFSFRSVGIIVVDTPQRASPAHAKSTCGASNIYTEEVRTNTCTDMTRGEHERDEEESFSADVFGSAINSLLNSTVREVNDVYSNGSSRVDVARPHVSKGCRATLAVCLVKETVPLIAKVLGDLVPRSRGGRRKENASQKTSCPISPAAASEVCTNNDRHGPTSQDTVELSPALLYPLLSSALLLLCPASYSVWNDRKRWLVASMGAPPQEETAATPRVVDEPLPAVNSNSALLIIDHCYASVLFPQSEREALRYLWSRASHTAHCEDQNDYSSITAEEDDTRCCRCRAFSVIGNSSSNNSLGLRRRLLAELHFTSLVLSKYPKSPEVMAHRLWVCQELLRGVGGKSPRPPAAEMCEYLILSPSSLRTFFKAADKHHRNYPLWFSLVFPLLSRLTLPSKDKPTILGYSSSSSSLTTLEHFVRKVSAVLRFLAIVAKEYLPTHPTDHTATQCIWAISRRLHQEVLDAARACCSSDGAHEEKGKEDDMSKNTTTLNTIIILIMRRLQAFVDDSHRNLLFNHLVTLNTRSLVRDTQQYATRLLRPRHRSRRNDNHNDTCNSRIGGCADSKESAGDTCSSGPKERANSRSQKGQQSEQGVVIKKIKRPAHSDEGASSLVSDGDSSSSSSSSCSEETIPLIGSDCSCDDECNGDSLVGNENERKASKRIARGKEDGRAFAGLARRGSGVLLVGGGLTSDDPLNSHNRQRQREEDGYYYYYFGRRVKRSRLLPITEGGWQVRLMLVKDFISSSHTPSLSFPASSSCLVARRSSSDTNDTLENEELVRGRSFHQLNGSTMAFVERELELVDAFTAEGGSSPFPVDSFATQYGLALCVLMKKEMSKWYRTESSTQQESGSANV